MGQDITNNMTNVGFYVCAKELDFDFVASLLNIEIYTTRSKNTFKFEEFAKDYWMIDSGYADVIDMNEQLEKVFSQIRDKADEINLIREKYAAECGFDIHIKYYNLDSPAPGTYFESDFVSFAGKINAEIGMDFVPLVGENK